MLIEGGQTTSTEFINQKLIDEIYLFVALKMFGQGDLSILGNLDKILNISDIKIERLSDNLLIKGNVKYSARSN